ncbi:MAG: hypothetical protein WCT20_03200 [Candidatus Babeliales bacterium]|jgi:hypothetical protein
MNRYTLPLFFVTLSTCLAANEVPVHQIKPYVEQQVAALLTKEAITPALLSPSIAAALDKNIHLLIHTMQKKNTIAVDQAKLDQTVKKLITTFVNELRQSVESKDIEKIVASSLNKLFANAKLSIAAIPPQMKAEYTSKKEYVIKTLKNMATQTSVTMADVSVITHATFDQFIERLGYMKISQTGRELVASIGAHVGEQKCSSLTIPEGIKDTLRGLLSLQQVDTDQAA